MIPRPHGRRRARRAGAAAVAATAFVTGMSGAKAQEPDPFASRFDQRTNFQIKFRTPEPGGEVRLYTKKPVRFEKDQFWEGSEEVLIEYQDIKIKADAARYAGWSPATLYRILRATSPAHVEFRDEVRAVETELELRLAGTVTQAAYTDPRLALAMLERRFGERWGRRATPSGTVADAPGSTIAPQRGVVVLEPALVETIIPALLAARLGPGGTPEARHRVERFARRVGPDEDA